MRPSQWPWRLAAAGLILLLGNGCGRDEEPRATPSPSRGAIELEESPQAAPPREYGTSPAEKCIEMATREDWAAALDPCTRAARDHPEDEAIQKALERAVEAAEGQIE